jgi:hypothetical protein
MKSFTPQAVTRHGVPKQKEGVNRGLSVTGPGPRIAAYRLVLDLDKGDASPASHRLRADRAEDRPQ